MEQAAITLSWRCGNTPPRLNPYEKKDHNTMLWSFLCELRSP